MPCNWLRDMPTVSDLIEGSTIEETMENGVTATRTFIVSGISGAATARSFIALNSSGIPAILEYHPSITDLRCVSKNAEPVNGSSSQFRVTAQYRAVDNTEDTEDPQAQMSIGSTVQEEQTSFDVNGTLIEIGPVTIDGVEHPKQTGHISAQKPQTTVTFKRRELEAPDLIAQNFTGKVNGAQFLGLGPDHILCTKIEGSSTDGGQTFDVTYEFQINFGKWFASIYYVDSEKSLPLEGATEANGGIKRNVQVYERADFNALALQ